MKAGLVEHPPGQFPDCSLRRSNSCRLGNTYLYPAQEPPHNFIASAVFVG
jgi:hypothetical protein